MRKEVFRSDNVVYRSEGVKLLDNFSMHIFEGEVFGLFFTDNRGKNELIRLAMEGGVLDYGSLSFCDEKVNSFLTPAPSRMAGVSLVSRDELLLDEMTVAENVFVMRKKFRKYVIDSGVIRSQFERLAAEYGVDIDGGALVRDLPAADRYIVRLLKAVVEGSFMIIVKDIGLSPNGLDIKRFHHFIRRFAGSGLAFLYVSGDPGELLGISDRIGVAERGRIVSTVRRENFGETRFVKYYFHPAQAAQEQKFSETRHHTVLDFDAALPAGAGPVKLDVFEGECVLLWDRSDMMIEQIARVLNGEIKPASGRVLIEGRELASFKGLAPISIIRETPSRHGVFSDMSYLDNLCMKASNRIPSLWRKNSIKQNIRSEYHMLAGDDIDALAPLALSPESMYNLVYLREHIFRPKLLVLVRPFLDTDVRLKLHILSLIELLRKGGASLLILDSSVSDSSAIADRTLTINDGWIEKGAS